ncbi:MAG: hypothetical protein [Olavius algarvensis Delta 4 endosymbiont]|nr:MAG: hypothetical protein [Olavius algarvensis Delta 4 endosymbiont]
MTQIQNRSVYITGGSSGIGLAAARHVAARGAHVGLFARDPDKLAGAAETVRNACAQEDQTVYSSAMDVSDRDDVRAKCGQAMAEFGIPDILITSAGIPMAGRFENTAAEHFDAVLQTNLYGTRHVIAALLPAMKARGSGHIVPVSSSAGLFGVYGYSAYGASKFALVGLAECLRSELLNHHIRVSVFCSPEVDTPLLAAEKDDLPPVTRKLKNLGGTLSVDYAAEYPVKGIIKNRFMIIPGFRAKVFYWLKRLMPLPVFWGLPDFIVKKMDR